MNTPSDWELVALARAGDDQAFGALVRRHENGLIAFCHRMTGSRDDAEDLAQECFIRVYRYLWRLRPEAKFSTVLFGMARNLTLNFLRDAKRRGRCRTQPLTSHDAVQERVCNPLHTPDSQARLSELEARLERTLELLSPEHREILVLRELNGLDYDAIAAVIRRRKGTVRSRLARAREQFRIRWLELGGGDL
ncbi:MAG TPA: sigma-70 family RNA polymerase sigma factor [Candidatus Hydrogenedentes bacterium]|jgi:RNA polymerase sigma-70 factor (ECF subfamily)|nr:sigma-70 family RNA polymerase sigma factor [Candidatus Hydrogenedentota bacterium]